MQMFLHSIKHIFITSLHFTISKHVFLFNQNEFVFTKIYFYCITFSFDQNKFSFNQNRIKFNKKYSHHILFLSIRERSFVNIWILHSILSLSAYLVFHLYLRSSDNTVQWKLNEHRAPLNHRDQNAKKMKCLSIYYDYA